MLDSPELLGEITLDWSPGSSLATCGQDGLSLDVFVVGITECSPDSITDIPQVLSGAVGLW
jgi:hypothetical protein